MTYARPPAPPRPHPPISYRSALSLDSDPGDGVVLLAASVLGRSIVLGVTWVLFGWFEHMLRVLVAIADHTYRG